MPFVEIDEIAVNAELLARIKQGDDAAKEEVRKELSGIFLYMHALCFEEPYEIITLREAHELGLVSSVVIADITDDNVQVITKGDS